MNIADWSDDNLRRFGDYDSLVTGNRCLRSSEVHEHACLVAGALQKLGVAPGDRVLLALPLGPELAAAAVAVWRCGAVVVLLAPKAPVAEIERTVRDCEPVAILATPDGMPNVDAAGGAAPHRLVVETGDSVPEGWVSLPDLVLRSEPLARSVPRDAEDIAQLCYTSGTTASSKAVVYTHGGIDARLRDFAPLMSQGQPESEVALLALPPSAFGGSFLAMRLASKTKTVLLGTFEAGLFVAAIERHRVTRTGVVPTMCEALLSFADLDRYDWSSLTKIIVSGAPASPALVEALESRFRVPIFVSYGLTEAGAGVTWRVPGSKRGSVGKVISGVEVQVRDEGDNLAPAGTAGEIWVKAPWAGRGFYKRPEETAAVFRDGWISTGDRGFFDDEELFIVGRSKELIIQGGFSVYPQEIVEVIGQAPGVKECAVMGMPHALLGEEVVACIVRREGSQGASLEPADVWAICREQLDERKVPGRIVFFDALPRNALGKVALVELRASLEAKGSAVVETALALRLRDAPVMERSPS